MTEYDFSPGAAEAWRAKLQGIAQWTQNVPCAPDQLANPFQAPARSDCDFYSSSKHHQSSRSRGHSRHRGHRDDGRHRRSRSHHHGRSRGWDSESSSSSSDDGGPDRPPTPPASAPVYGNPTYPNGYTSPWPQHAQPQVYGGFAGYGGGGGVRIASPNVMVPMWNGTGWVLASPAPQQQPQYLSPTYSAAPQDSGKRLSRKDSRRREKERPKASRRDSHSVPPPVSPPLYLSVPPVQNGQSYVVYQGGQGQGSSPASAWSAPLPGSAGVASPPAYPQSQQPGYFAQAPVASAGAGAYYGNPAVQVHSPAGSLHNAGYYASPQVSAWGSYSQQAPVSAGIGSYGAPGAYGAGAWAGGVAGYGPVRGQGVVIVDGAKPRKGYEGGGAWGSSKEKKAGSVKSGKSGRTIWGRFVGGM